MVGNGRTEWKKESVTGEDANAFFSPIPPKGETKRASPKILGIKLQRQKRGIFNVVDFFTLPRKKEEKNSSMSRSRQKNSEQVCQGEGEINKRNHPPPDNQKASRKAKWQRKNTKSWDRQEQPPRTTKEPSSGQ